MTMICRSMGRGRGSGKRTALTALATLSLLLGACASSPDSTFYTLYGSIDASGSQRTAVTGTTATTAAAAATQTAATPLLIELGQVGIPSEVAKPQLVVASQPGQVQIKETHRWAGPLDEQIRTALSQRLSRDLGAIDIYGTPRASGASVYRITVKVGQFESALDRRASIDAVWTVRRTPGDALMTCRTIASVAVGAGYDALVLGHRQAIDRLATDIAQAVRTLQSVPLAQAEPAATSTASATSASSPLAISSPVPTPCPLD